MCTRVDEMMAIKERKGGTVLVCSPSIMIIKEHCREKQTEKETFLLVRVLAMMQYG